MTRAVYIIIIFFFTHCKEDDNTPHNFGDSENGIETDTSKIKIEQKSKDVENIKKEDISISTSANIIHGSSNNNGIRTTKYSESGEINDANKTNIEEKENTPITISSINKEKQKNDNKTIDKDKIIDDEKSKSDSSIESLCINSKCNHHESRENKGRFDNNSIYDKPFPLSLHNNNSNNLQQIKKGLNVSMICNKHGLIWINLGMNDNGKPFILSDYFVKNKNRITCPACNVKIQPRFFKDLAIAECSYSMEGDIYPKGYYNGDRNIEFIKKKGKLKSNELIMFQYYATPYNLKIDLK